LISIVFLMKHWQGPLSPKRVQNRLIEIGHL